MLLTNIWQIHHTLPISHHWQIHVHTAAYIVTWYQCFVIMICSYQLTYQLNFIIVVVIVDIVLICRVNVCYNKNCHGSYIQKLWKFHSLNSNSQVIRCLCVVWSHIDEVSVHWTKSSNSNCVDYHVDVFAENVWGRDSHWSQLSRFGH